MSEEGQEQPKGQGGTGSGSPFGKLLNQPVLIVAVLALVIVVPVLAVTRSGGSGGSDTSGATNATPAPLAEIQVPRAEIQVIEEDINKLVSANDSARRQCAAGVRLPGCAAELEQLTAVLDAAEQHVLAASETLQGRYSDYRNVLFEMSIKASMLTSGVSDDARALDSFRVRLLKVRNEAG